MITNVQLRALKSQLTRAENSGDPRQVLSACAVAFGIFERDGYPDCWHRWNIAQHDAEFRLRIGR